MQAARDVPICDIQRFSVHDGPGIRTTIFFKGCPLACQWCHNPETISFHNELVFSVSDCIGCGDCVPACSKFALALHKGHIRVDFAACDGCMRCTELCPSGALKPAARPCSSEALLAEVLRDFNYYGEDGGITLSGGEPLIHVAFLKEFLPKAKAAGLHVVAETAGHWAYEQLVPVLEHVGLFLFDVKMVDGQRHREYTGRSNARILQNLRRLLAEGRDVRVRMPLVPGRNIDSDNLTSTAKLIASLGLSTITLLPYHSLGEGKLAKIGGRVRPLGLRPPAPEEIAHARSVFESCGVQVEPAAQDAPASHAASA